MKKILAGLVALAGAVAGAEELTVGQPAPDFSAHSTGGAIKLADYRGKWLVLYFYPKSFTPGCTAESCSLRDAHKDLQGAGAVIVGSSFDAIDQQAKFKSEYKLPFELIADVDKKVATAYGAVMLGGMMTARKTFIIDPQGRVAALIGQVSTSSHDDQVLAELKKAQAAATTPAS